MNAAALAGIRPTRSLEQATETLRSDGVCILEGAIAPGLMADIKAALDRAADNDERRGWRRKYPFGADDGINQRIWNLPSRDPAFCDLAEHPAAVHFVREMLGWPALLSSMSANVLYDGGASMTLHADQGFMPEPWARTQGLNVALCVDDFTAENGATCIVAGSLGLNRAPTPSDLPAELTPLEAPAGSLVVLDGRMWHTNGVNRNGVRRAGIFSFYTLPIYLPQENWYLSVNPSIRQFGSETLLTLLGFRPQFLGRVNGLDGV